MAQDMGTEWMENLKGRTGGQPGWWSFFTRLRYRPLIITLHYIQGMIRLALAMLSLRSMEGAKVEFVHVRGHSGDLGNEGADYLARVGATRAAVDDYDWDTMREAVEKDIRDLQGRQIAGTCEGLQVLIEVWHFHSAAL
jgi:RNase H